jgi:hypothetical protein
MERCPQAHMIDRDDRQTDCSRSRFSQLMINAMFILVVEKLLEEPTSNNSFRTGSSNIGTK